jgi:hypothetical protein
MDKEPPACGSPEARERWRVLGSRAYEDEEDVAGEPACLAHVVCQACGAAMTVCRRAGKWS